MFFFSSRRRHTRWPRDWSSDVCSSDLETTKFTFPDVNPEVMGSLSDLLDKKITMEEMKKRVLTTLEEISDRVIRPDFSDHELTLFERRYEQMIKRNEKIAELQEQKRKRPIKI